MKQVKSSNLLRIEEKEGFEVTFYEMLLTESSSLLASKNFKARLMQVFSILLQQESYQVNAILGLRITGPLN